jgi:hypothetical protein
MAYWTATSAMHASSLGLHEPVLIVSVKHVLQAVVCSGVGLVGQLAVQASRPHELISSHRVAAVFVAPPKHTWTAVSSAALLTQVSTWLQVWVPQDWHASTWVLQTPACTVP